MTAWPDDLDVAINRHWIASHLAMGAAICVRCAKPHRECGEQHLIQPWSIAPRCTDCGAVLRMPEHQEAA